MYLKNHYLIHFSYVRSYFIIFVFSYIVGIKTLYKLVAADQRECRKIRSYIFTVQVLLDDYFLDRGLYCNRDGLLLVLVLFSSFNEAAASYIYV